MPKTYPADEARKRAEAKANSGELIRIRPNVDPDELWDACRVLQDNGWAGGITMGNAIRALVDAKHR